MTEKFSFTKYEREILPNFREKISKAESIEDVKKFFVYTVKELFENVFKGRMSFYYEDFALTLGTEPYYRLSRRLLSSEDFVSVWDNSDLPRVVYRLVESSRGRCKRLEKHPEKTDSKIRM